MARQPPPGDADVHRRQGFAGAFGDDPVAVEAPRTIDQVGQQGDPRAGADQATHTLHAAGPPGDARGVVELAPDPVDQSFQLIELQRHHRFVFQFGQGQPIDIGQRVAGGKPGAAFAAQQHLVINRAAFLEVGDDQQRQIELAADQHVFDIAALVLDQIDRDPREQFAEPAEQVGQEIAGHHRGNPDPHRTCGLVLIAADAASHVGNRADDRAGMAQELVPFAGQRHALGMAVEQGDPGFQFKRADRVGDRALRDPDRARSARNRARLCHGDKVANLAESDVHRFFR